MNLLHGAPKHIMVSAIGEMKDGVYALRGTSLPDLIREGDFVSSLWLAWTGERPALDVRRLIEACLIASIDHGAEPPSAHVTRVVASAGKPLAESVATGLLTLGARHGNAGSAAARWVSEAVSNSVSAADVIADFDDHGQRVPGIGHPVYEVDPRAETLFDLARVVLPSDKHLKLISEVAYLLSQKKGKTMPVNVDGAIGSIVAALGVQPELADAIFLVARAGGLVAHAREEASDSQGTYKRG